MLASIYLCGKEPNIILRKYFSGGCFFCEGCLWASTSTLKKKICKQWVLCILKLPIVDCDNSTATVLIWGSSITIHYIQYLAQQLAAFHVFDPLTSKIWEKIITTSRIAKIFQTRGSHIVTPRLSNRLSCWHPQNAAKLWFIFQISTLDPLHINERSSFN